MHDRRVAVHATEYRGRRRTLQVDCGILTGDHRLGALEKRRRLVEGKGRGEQRRHHRWVCVMQRVAQRAGAIVGQLRINDHQFHFGAEDHVHHTERRAGAQDLTPQALEGFAMRVLCVHIG